MDQDQSPKVVAPAGSQSKTGGKRFWLEHKNHSIELQPGTVIVGRSSTCHLVLDDALVSRRHAQFVVTTDSVTVEDYGSVNGVYVNSRRITGATNLRFGDHVQIGRQELVLRSALVSGGPDARRYSAETLHGTVTEAPRMVTETEATFSADTLDLLGGVAEKVLALGRGDEAERVLGMSLSSILSEVRAGRTTSPTSALFEKAARYAVRLGGATGKGKWVDYVIELYDALARPMPAPIVDELYEVLRKTSNINLGALRAYLAALRAQNLGPSERFSLQRLEGLERVAALR